MTLTSISFLKPYIRLIQVIGFLAIFLTLSNKANAIDLSIDEIEIRTANSGQSFNFISKTIPLIKTYEENYFASMAKTIRNKYLTFYSKKHEKIRASYARGAYLIKYTSDW